MKCKCLHQRLKRFLVFQKFSSQAVLTFRVVRGQQRQQQGIIETRNRGFSWWSHKPNRDNPNKENPKSVAGIGQPHPITHPHLFSNSQQVTPLILKDEYKSRRARISTLLYPNSVLVLSGFSLRYATRQIFYPFHQQTDFLYLTGFNQPDAALLLWSSDLSQTRGGYELFMQPVDPSTVKWDGPRATPEAACNFFGAEKTHAIDKLGLVLNEISNLGVRVITDLELVSPLAEYDPCSYSGSATHSSKTRIEASEEIQRIRLPGLPCIEKIGSLIDGLRVIKSCNEIELMRVAGRIGRAMAMTEPGVLEDQVHATLEYHGKMQGATNLSYVPVVAGGTNALTLHYVSNNQILKKGTLVLVDAGVEYAGYVSDITRTWPVDRVFTPSQRNLYSMVLDIQKRLIENVKVGWSLDKLQSEAWRLLKDGLQNLLGRVLSYSEMNVLYPHHVGHYIGMDVHDTASISRSKPLEPGMVITIEPGVYIPDNKDRYGAYAGMGVRIEDDVCVTLQGPDVLTSAAPKEIKDIEIACRATVTL